MAGDVLSADADLDLGAVVAGLRQSRDVLHNVRYRGPVQPPPSRAAIEETLGQFARALFPAHYGQLERRDPALPPTPEMIDDYVGSVLEQALTALRDHLRRTLPSLMPSRGLRRISIDVRARSFALLPPAFPPSAACW
jgi:hypothetical protein